MPQSKDIESVRRIFANLIIEQARKEWDESRKKKTSNTKQKGAEVPVKDTSVRTQLSKLK